MKIHRNIKLVFFVVTLLIIFTFACGSTAPTAEPVANTPVPPTDTEIPPTDTPIPTDTPAPTDTPVPTDTPLPTETPTEIPTETPDLAATEAAEAAQKMEEAAALVGETLESIGLSADNGSLAWIQSEAIPVLINGGSLTTFKPIDDGDIYNNYVLNFDVTWETSTGFAGCGILFHSEDNITKGKQYRFYTLRLSGLPGWDVELWDYGTWQSTTTGTVKYNSLIDQENDAVNQYTLVIQKGIAAVYANGERMSNVIISLNKGRIGVFAWQELEHLLAPLKMGGFGN